MKPKQLWPFVVGRSWNNCTSLRVTEGDLLDNLFQTYRELFEQGYVLRFTTSIYETVLMSRTRTCLKKPAASHSNHSYSSSSSDSASITENENADQELTKVSFTYYGTSVEQLCQVLKKDGLANISRIKIFEQNPHFRKKNKMIAFPNLKDLCDKLCKDIVPPTLVLFQDREFFQNENLNVVDLAGRQRTVFKRKFTTGNMFWSGQQDEKGSVLRLKDDVNSILSPLNRHLLLEKKRARRQKLARQKDLYAILQEMCAQSNDPYEKWWFRLKNLTKVEERLPEEDSLENNCISDQSVDSLVLKPNVRNKKLSPKQKKEKAMTDLHTTKTSGPIVVSNLEAVDSWKCECDICTGAFLRSRYAVPGARRRRNLAGGAGLPQKGQRRLVNRRERSQETKKKNGKLNQTFTISEEELDGDDIKPLVTIKEDMDSKHAKISHSTTSKLLMGPSSRKQHRKVTVDPNIWWSSVSTYTTPYWKQKNENRPKSQDSNLIDDMKNDSEIKCSTKRENINSRKLKLTYSFDRLKKQRSMRSSQETFSLNTTYKNDEKTKLTSVETTTSSLLDEQSESLDMTALGAHGIVYSYEPGTTHCYTKLNLKEDDLESEEKTVKPQPNEAQEAKSIGVPPQQNEKDQNETLQEPEHVTKEIASEVELVLSPPMNELQSPEDKCRDFLASNLPNRSVIQGTDSPVCQHFENIVPKEFSTLCVAALQSFIVRRETLMTSNTFQRIESLTVNRIPLFSYEDNLQENKRSHVNFIKSDYT
ncbi:uncharacterized protein LOC143445285 isoform X3 [Clavelina lepadiformis]